MKKTHIHIAAIVILTAISVFCPCVTGRAAYFGGQENAASFLFSAHIVMDGGGEDGADRFSLTNQRPEARCTVKLEAAKENVPLPDQTEMTALVRGSADVHFGAVDCHQDGIYRYKMYQIPEKSSRILYDDTVYYIQITVSGSESAETVPEMSAVVTRENGGAKVDRIQFRNQYIVYENSAGDGTKTGDKARFLMYELSVFLSGMAALLMILMMRRKKYGDQEREEGCFSCEREAEKGRKAVLPAGEGDIEKTAAQESEESPGESTAEEEAGQSPGESAAGEEAGQSPGESAAGEEAGQASSENFGEKEAERSSKESVNGEETG